MSKRLLYKAVIFWTVAEIILTTDDYRRQFRHCLDLAPDYSLAAHDAYDYNQRRVPLCSYGIGYLGLMVAGLVAVSVV